MNIEKLKLNVLDTIFYCKNYLKCNYNKRLAFGHYKKIGLNENNVANKIQLKNRYKISLQHSILNINYIKYKINNNVIFNILIRTSKRPLFFKNCFESIKKQDFPGIVNIYISYDTFLTKEYLNKYENINKIFVENKGNYSFNLYCNELIEEVNNGWILFLDDDDMFLNNNVLSIISSFIKDENDLILWNFLRPDKIISPKKDIKKGEIDTTCVCFHSKFKNLSKWKSISCGDFYFIKDLTDKNKFNIKKINLELTKTQFNDIVANYGNNIINF